jgi:hypothetical protein
MDFVTAIFGALKEFFAFKTKTALTPEQKEVQTARKNHEQTQKAIAAARDRANARRVR